MASHWVGTEAVAMGMWPVIGLRLGMWHLINIGVN